MYTALSFAPGDLGSQGSTGGQGRTKSCKEKQKTKKQQKNKKTNALLLQWEAESAALLQWRAKMLMPETHWIYNGATIIHRKPMQRTANVNNEAYHQAWFCEVKTLQKDRKFNLIGWLNDGWSHSHRVVQRAKDKFC